MRCQSLCVLSSQEQISTTDTARSKFPGTRCVCRSLPSLHVVSDRHASPLQEPYTDARHASPTHNEALGAPGNVPGMTVSPQAEHCEEKALQ